MNNKLSILQVAHGFPPKEQAGAELHCFFIGQELARMGHRVEAFTRYDSADEPIGAITTEEFAGLPVTRVNRSMSRETSLVGSTYSAPVRKAFEKQLARGFQVVHFHHLYGLSADLVEAAKAAGAKVVFTLHDFWFICPLGQMFSPGHGGRLCPEINLTRCSRCLLKKRLGWALNAFTDNLGKGIFPNPLKGIINAASYLRRNLHTRPLKDRLETLIGAINQADIILSPSKFLLEQYRRCGLSTAKSHWFEYGMGDTWAADLPKKEAPAQPIRFGFIGSFLHSKGVELLVNAYKSIPPGKGELHLHGSSPWDGGAYAAELKQNCSHPDIHFHGHFPHEQLPEIMAPLDVLIVPSRWYENAPLTLDEASLARIPVITTGHGGMSEAIERRKNGLLFKPDDPADLRQAILRFTAEPQLWQELRNPAVPIKGMAEQARKLVDLLHSSTPGEPGG